jgi:hypothetical protein
MMLFAVLGILFKYCEKFASGDMEVAA